jgi:hypothetical protein
MRSRWMARRSRRRRALPPGQRTLPLPELTRAEAIYGYSLILTSLDVPAPDRALKVSSAHYSRIRV